MPAAVGQARDLDADLAICEAATPGPLVICEKYIVQDRYDKDDYRQAIFKPLHLPMISADMKFAAAAREGWPVAIRRALEAEAKIDRLENELRMLQDVHNRNRRCWD